MIRKDGGEGVWPTWDKSSVLDRLELHTAFGECWIWTGCVGSNGYGRMKYEGKTGYVHRIAYEAYFGPIRPGNTIDHLCFTRACWRPDHLEDVPMRENIQRGPRASQTHCKRGHPLNGLNVYTYRGHRQCRRCRLVRSHAP